MSGVRLKPMDGASDIILSDGKTTIGRGPMMKVDDLVRSDNGRMENLDKKEDMNGQTKGHISHEDRAQQLITNKVPKPEQDFTPAPVIKSFNGSNERETFDPVNLQGIEKDQLQGVEAEDDHFPINPVAADPQDNARKLPGWMKSASSPTRQQKTSDFDEDEEQDTPQRRGRREEDYDADFVVDDLDVDDEDDEDETAPKARKRKQQAQKKKTSPKGKKPKFTAVYSSGEEDLGEDSGEESDEWTPNQRKKAAKVNRNKTKPRPRTPKKETSLPKAEPFIDYDRVTAGVTSSSRIELSEEEEEEELEEQTAQLTTEQVEEEDSDGSDRLPPCPYGLKCYRRNVHHFEEYSHPPGHQLGGVESDKPECPYGIKCLRSNPTHRKEYTHTQPPATARSGRPKRDSTSRKGESDDEANPMYEYDDTWLDASESSESYQDDPDDSDWEPEGGGQGSGGGGVEEFDEDVTELVAEARSFLRNKRN